MLSVREHRVAHLVAQGLTNQEIAKELYVTTKTVEYHLSNIFTKLGISSRRQLRSLLSDDSWPPDVAMGAGADRASGTARSMIQAPESQPARRLSG